MKKWNYEEWRGKRRTSLKKIFMDVSKGREYSYWLSLNLPFWLYYWLIIIDYRYIHRFNYITDCSLCNVGFYEAKQPLPIRHSFLFLHETLQHSVHEIIKSVADKSLFRQVDRRAKTGGRIKWKEKSNLEK